MEPVAALPQRSSRKTADIPMSEILQRLEMGRLEVKETADGSSLAWKLERERREAGGSWDGVERRRGDHLLAIPTRFPEKGPILCLVVGGWADDRTLREPLPFWRDDDGRGFMVWQALQQAGLLHKRDGEFALGRGGFWDEEPPRTLGLAMTYGAYRRRGEAVDFEDVIRPWNLKRLQHLVEACHARSMDRLRIVVIGEVARVLMCAVTYGMSGIPILTLPDPATTTDVIDWIGYAADLLAVAR